MVVTLESLRDVSQFIVMNTAPEAPQIFHGFSTDCPQVVRRLSADCPQIVRRLSADRRPKRRHNGPWQGVRWTRGGGGAMTVCPVCYSPGTTLLGLRATFPIALGTGMRALQNGVTGGHSPAQTPDALTLASGPSPPLTWVTGLKWARLEVALWRLSGGGTGKGMPKRT